VWLFTAAGASELGKLATIVLNRSAPTPTRVRGRGVHYKVHSNKMETGDEEQDAEIAEELEEDEQMDAEADLDAPAEEEDDSDADAEVADEDDEEDDEGEIVGAVKTRSGARPKRKRVEEDESVADEEVVENESDEESEKSVEEDWEAADDAREDLDVGNAAANRCV